MSRRELIRNAGIAGAAAWTAPAIIGSVVSPAAAVTGGPITCSWFFVIFQRPASAGGGIFFTGAEQSSGSVCTDHANSNICGCKTCNGVIYSMDENDFFTGGCGSGTAVPDIGAACVNFIQINGNTVSATNGATILASFSHVGSVADCACPGATTPNNSVTVCVDGGCESTTCT
jgi:hypothetical protein